jgi:hypothetical protein
MSFTPSSSINRNTTDRTGTGFGRLTTGAGLVQ